MEPPEIELDWDIPIQPKSVVHITYINRSKYDELRAQAKHLYLTLYEYHYNSSHTKSHNPDICDICEILEDYRDLDD